jgi:serine/threonine protein phosphatase PrpC
MQVAATLKAAADSHPGLQRSNNEDRYHADSVRGLFLVVDGVGGQAAGEKAAETALTMVRTRLERETGALEDRVREAIALANNEIHRLASLRAEWQGMACVLTVAVVSNGDVIVGHVGDTRLYKLRAGRIEKLTHDHSPVGEREDAGELSEREAMQHPRRNEVYRDVGSELHDPDDLNFIDVFHRPFEQDAALLLCSDGLTDGVSTSEIADIVNEWAGHPNEVVRQLIDAANAAGGKDNVTIVYVEGARFAEEDDTRDLRRRTHGPDSGRIPHEAVSVASGTGRAPVVGNRSKRWRLATLVVLLIAVAGSAAYLQRDRLPLADLRQLWAVGRVQPGAAVRAAILRVDSTQSIGAAIASAAPGAEVLVEPGEYREQLRFKTGVRITSRVPRGAILRLPGGASETDAAVIGFDVSDVVFSGFRIQGDAATPLGAGIVIRNSTVSLNDLDISGARSAAIEYVGNGGGSVVGVDLHDNPGVAIAVRAGTSPRIVHNAFMRNATSETAAGTLLVEAGSRPSIAANTFHGVSPESIIVPPGMGRTTLVRDNWFVNPPAEHPAAQPARPARGRR